MIDISIFFIIYMQIGLIRFLKDGSSNAKYDLEGKLSREYAGLDWNYNTKIKEAITAIKGNKDKV